MVVFHPGSMLLMKPPSGILWHLLICIAFTPFVNSLVLEPKFLLVDEDWSVETPLNVRICSKRRISGVRIASGNVNGRFQIVPYDEFCGRLKLGEPLDADDTSERGTGGKAFKLVFEERSTKRRANLDIQVADVNDNAPIFTNLPTEINVTEGTRLLTGTRVYTVETTDADNGIGGVVRFSLRGSPHFRIGSGRCSGSKCTADVTLAHGLEKERPAKFLLEVVARDGAGVSQRVNEASALLSINILRSEQTTAPVELPLPTTGVQPTGHYRALTFVSPPRHETLRVAANSRLSSRIVKVEANGVDSKDAGSIVYSIEPLSHHFEIDSHSGWISIKNSLADVAGSTLPLNVQAKLVGAGENGEPISSDAVSLPIGIEVIGEGASSSHPVCASRHYTATLNKHSAKIALSEAIKVYDENQVAGEEFTIGLKGEHSQLFELRPQAVKASGDVSIHVRERDSLRLLNEKELELEIQLFTRTDGKRRLAGQCLLTLRIFNPLNALSTAGTARESHTTTTSDTYKGRPPSTTGATLVNFTPPTTTAATLSIAHHHDVSVRENLDPRPILNLFDEVAASAVADIRAEIVSIDCPKCTSYFAVDSHGRLTTLRPLDAEEFSHARLDITVEDSAGKRWGGPISVDVSVLDENDNLPVFSQPVCEVFVDACATNTSVLPTPSEVLCTVSAVDADITGNVVTYSLSRSAQPHFTIDSQQGTIRMVSNPTVADLDAYEFEVVASDSGTPARRESRANVSIHFARCPFHQPREENSTGGIADGDGDNRTARGELPLPPSVALYTATVAESSPVGTRLFEVGLPQTAPGQSPTTIVLEEEQGREGLLMLLPNGSIHLNGPLDFERFQQLNASIYAVSHATTSTIAQVAQQSSLPGVLLARLVLSIEDENDNGPVFRLPNNYKVLLIEWRVTSRPLRLPLPLAVDADGEDGPFAHIEYSIQHDQQRLFEINKRTSEIRLTRPVAEARQQADETRLVVKAVDNPEGISGRRNSAQLTLIIVLVRHATRDSNARRILDSVPSPLSVEIYADTDPESPADMLIHSFNSTMLLPEDLILSVEHNASVGGAHIELHDNNELRLVGRASKLAGRRICTRVKAEWAGNDPTAPPAPVIQSREICVLVTERRREASHTTPHVTIIWPRQNSIHTFKENRNYSSLLHVTANPPPGHDGDVRFRIAGSSASQQFAVNASGRLQSLRPFDYERESRYWVEIEACVGSNRSTCAATQASVGIWVAVEDDESDNCPYFADDEETKRLHVMENGAVPVGEPPVYVGSFTAALYGDGRSGENSCCYSLLDDFDGTFVLTDPRRTELAIRRSLDRELVPRYHLTVVANNCPNTSITASNCGSSAESAFAVRNQRSPQKTIWVEVEDANDCLPQFARREYFAKVMERVTQVGEPVLQLRATDEDVEPQGLHYHLSSSIETERGPVPSSEEPFKVNSTTGTITSNLLYSYDVPRSYSFRVAVVDGANHQDECQVTISVVNYKQQVEFTFDADQNMLEKSLDRIEKLLTEAVGFKGVVDELIFFPNYTTIVCHFIDQRGLALSGTKVKALFEENDSEGGQRARRELRSQFQHVYPRDPDHNPQSLDRESEAASNSPRSALSAMVEFEKLLPSLSNGGIPAIVFYSMLFLLLTLVLSLLSLACCKSSGGSVSARLANTDYRWDAMADEPFYSDNTLLHRHGGCQTISYPTLNKVTILPNNASLGRRPSADGLTRHDVYSNPRTQATARSTEF